MTDTANLRLPCIEGSQAQKHVTHNEALRILDTLVQLAVKDRDLTAPPELRYEGDRYIVNAEATGAWAGCEDAIMAWQDGAWQISAPRVGWLAYVIDEGALLAWDGIAWVDFFASLTTLQNLSLLGVGTTADAGNPLSAKLNHALFAARTVTEGGNGDLRYTLNKESAGNTLSFVFQDNWSARAEIGLAGDDNFHLKVSPDGASWTEALVIDGASGRPSLPRAAKFCATTNFDNYIAANSWTKVQFNIADLNDQGAFSAGGNSFTAPFAGAYVFGFSLRFKANATVPTQVTVAFYKNGAELGCGRAMSGAPVDGVTTYNLTVLAPCAKDDIIDVRVRFDSHDGYVSADQSQFFGHYVP
ncbi:DUF2793 domain-containing protein [Undibacter mobilis]|uniref:DUF2793 domain-containing protein n=1 Tax=Undibacter mobilis TaxID=2292256 RepID=A0A371B3G4_9BRAD|nr:DUF2793 domain-containing protein [Undibacter mobilis]RDV02136.1 DUF2793 domain-containing protein [Undibacter mobilis]